MSKTKVEVKKGRGRPNHVKKIVLQNSIHFAAKTDKEMVIMLLDKTPIKTFMKPASDEILQRNLYVSVRKARAESLAAGKKVEFRGRNVAGVKKTRWIHSPAVKAAKSKQISPAQAGV